MHLNHAAPRQFYEPASPGETVTEERRLPELLIRKTKWLLGVLLLLTLLRWPDDMLAGVQQAVRLWYYSVAPAIFPFMALMPLLTCPESAEAWRRLAGRAMEKLFDLPGEAAPGMIIAMLAGSPAGAAALANIAGKSGMNIGQLQRLSGAVCGLSPAFLTAGVGAAMLRSPGDGFILLRSQLLAQLLLLLIFRGTWRDRREKVSFINSEWDAAPVRTAVVNVLTVCGYMALFSGVARVCGRILGERAGNALLCVLDLPSGAGVISSLFMERNARLMLLSLMTGFGGACIIAQNMCFLRPLGVHMGRFFAMRGLSALFSALGTALQLWLKLDFHIVNSNNPYAFALLSAVFLTIPAFLFLKKHIS